MCPGNIDWTSGNFSGAFNTPSWDGKVLFNFYNATSVDLSNDSLGGYVVAPDANVTVGHDIDGGVMAMNLTVDSEIDLPNNTDGASAWDGALPNPVPEAPTCISGLGAAFAAAASLWRGRRKLDEFSCP